MDLKFQVNNNKYFNVKDVLRSEFGISSRLYVKLRNNNRIYLNGKSNLTNTPISINDVIEVDLCFDEESTNIVSTKMDLDIVYEDDYLLVVNKAPNFAVHPSMKHFENSLSNGVKFYFDSIRS